MKPFRTLLHQIRVRPRLALSAGVVPAALFFLPRTLSGPTRALVAWDMGTGLYLALAWHLMLRGSVEKMRWRARLQDDGAAVVLGLTVAAAVASLAAIVLELVGVKSYSPRAQTLHLPIVAMKATPASSFLVLASRTTSTSCTSPSSSALRRRPPTSPSRRATCAGSPSCTA